MVKASSEPMSWTTFWYSGFFDAVAAFKLFNHQLRIGFYANFSGAEADCLLQGGDDSPVFRLVVGGVANAPGDAANDPALPVLYNHTDRRRPGVAR